MEAKFYFKIVLTHVFKGDAELLQALQVFDGDRHDVASLIIHFTVLNRELLRSKSLVADKLRDKNLPSEENFHPLNLGCLASISQKVFHTAIELGLEEVLKAFSDAKFFIAVCEQANIDN